MISDFINGNILIVSAYLSVVINLISPWKNYIFSVYRILYVLTLAVVVIGQRLKRIVLIHVYSFTTSINLLIWIGILFVGCQDENQAFAFCSVIAGIAQTTIALHLSMTGFLVNITQTGEQSSNIVECLPSYLEACDPPKYSDCLGSLV
jgi:hypothetical protein